MRAAETSERALVPETEDRLDRQRRNLLAAVRMRDLTHCLGLLQGPLRMNPLTYAAFLLDGSLIDFTNYLISFCFEKREQRPVRFV